MRETTALQYMAVGSVSVRGHGREIEPPLELGLEVSPAGHKSHGRLVCAAPGGLLAAHRSGFITLAGAARWPDGVRCNPPLTSAIAPQAGFITFHMEGEMRGVARRRRRGGARPRVRASAVCGCVAAHTGRPALRGPPSLQDAGSAFSHCTGEVYTNTALCDARRGTWHKHNPVSMSLWHTATKT